MLVIKKTDLIIVFINIRVNAYKYIIQVLVYFGIYCILCNINLYMQYFYKIYS